MAGVKPRYSLLYSRIALQSESGFRRIGHHDVCADLREFPTKRLGGLFIIIDNEYLVD